MAAAQRKENAKTKGGKRKAAGGVLSPQAIKRNELKAQALELRIQGWTLQTIADTIGKSVSTAHDLIDEAMSERVTYAAEEYRKITLERLEALLSGHMAAALNGDVPASGIVLSTIAQMRQITGMDAPVKSKVDLDAHLDAKIGVEHGGVIELVFVGADDGKPMVDLTPEPSGKSNGHG